MILERRSLAIRERTLSSGYSWERSSEDGDDEEERGKKEDEEEDDDFETVGSAVVGGASGEAGRESRVVGTDEGMLEAEGEGDE